MAVARAAVHAAGMRPSTSPEASAGRTRPGVAGIVANARFRCAN